MAFNQLNPELIRRYSTNGPRYTSYPSALSFTDAVGAAEWKQHLSEHLTSTKDVSVYIHIPFCPSLCIFCACNKVITKKVSTIEHHLNLLIKEISWAYGDWGREIRPKQIHFGGGSPSYLTVEQSDRVFTALNKTFSIDGYQPEISIEIDPRTTTREKLINYKRNGANRLSLGVQDFDEHVQQLINREQPYELTAEVIESARALGFSEINTDLIYGLPGQTIKTFTNTVEKLLTLRPGRIALYGYAHVPWVTKAQSAFERAPRPSADERISLFITAYERLVDAGYEHIGLDHFALPTDPLAEARREGDLRRNFMGYTTQKTDALLSFGMSAISSLPDIIVQNNRELAGYNESLTNNAHAITRGYVLSRDDRIRGDIIHSLLCLGWLSVPLIEERWGIDFWKYFPRLSEQLASYERDGLLEWSAAFISLTPPGRLLSRNIAMEFDAHITKGTPTTRGFSQTI